MRECDHNLSGYFSRFRLEIGISVRKLRQAICNLGFA